MNEQIDREHAFYRKWLSAYSGRNNVARDELQPLLKLDPMLGPAVGTLVRQLAENAQLSLEDARWLAYELGHNDFAVRQLNAYAVLYDEGLTWLEKLERVVRLDVRWAVETLLVEMPPELLEETLAIIATIHHSRRVLTVMARESAKLRRH